MLAEVLAIDDVSTASVSSADDDVLDRSTDSVVCVGDDDISPVVNVSATSASSSDDDDDVLDRSTDSNVLSGDDNISPVMDEMSESSDSADLVQDADELSCDSVQPAAAAGVLSLPRDSGLNTAEIMELLRARPTGVAVEQRIPRGVKSNVYCVIDNRRNMRTNASTNVFDDDCGAWNSRIGHNKYPYIERNGFKRIFWQASTKLYCQEVKESGRRVYKPHEPQPDPTSVFTLVRYTSTLKGSLLMIIDQ